MIRLKINGTDLQIIRTPPTGSKKNKAEECVTCKKEANVDAIECQWCTGWEHKVCANISSEEYVLLDTISTNIMFFVRYVLKKYLLHSHLLGLMLRLNH